MRLKDKVAIITGGAAGIGAATAKLFAEEGARVVIADVDENAGRRVADEINQKRRGAVFVKTDIASERDAQNACRVTVEKFGKLDVLVNNAAVFVLKSASEAGADDWQRSLNVNVVGTALMSKFAAERMKAGGAIVNLGSISSYVAQPNFITYSATKAAIVQMTRNLAMDLAAFDIRVNAVCPGTILTEATFEHLARVGMTMDDFLSEEAPKHLLKRVGEPHEVAAAILFLASDEASFITGASLMVDGGYTAK